MKVVLTGGGTGGHFYPLIAVAEDLRQRASETHLLQPTILYAAPEPYDEEALFANSIVFKKIHSGKVRRYFSLTTPFDLFMVAVGFVEALLFLFKEYPDVIFSKGGYASVPVVLAGGMLGIPIIIHDSDSKPGRATKLAAGFATYIAVSFGESAKFYKPGDQKKIAHTGTPIRSNLRVVSPMGLEQFIEGIDPSLPLILVLGGSLGAERVNTAIVEALPLLLPHVQVVHQTGRANLEEVKSLSRVVVPDKALLSRYHPVPYLDPVVLSRVAGRASVIVSRAGATAISEFALWKKPVILIPIPESISHDQRTNAYTYAKTGGAVVTEEQNLTPGILQTEVLKIVNDPVLQESMGNAGTTFARPDAGVVIADMIIKIGESHKPREDV
jgi:UDP-N-acetylglucosamine--N-acetylmuramyl-(pentapeptide) pyrophosphoryl-undecaprenol N-acetylglucosamine transferase